MFEAKKDEKYSTFIDQNSHSEYSVPLNKKRSCCCRFFCCCCIGKNVDDVKSFYIEKWKNFLTKENKYNKDIVDPFNVLTNLWGHKNASLNEFNKIRLNPNLLLEGFRNDLEFYIPQLCTFMIFGNMDVVEDFLSIMCKSCYASVFFTHRVIWFLKSMTPINNYLYKERFIFYLELNQF